MKILAKGLTDVTEKTWQNAQAVRHRMNWEGMTMQKQTSFKVKHVIVQTSKEERELHMKQTIAALLKMDKKDNPVSQTKSKM